MSGQVGRSWWELLPQEDRGGQVQQGGAEVPKEARLRRCLQEPRGGFASAVEQRRLTKRSPELRFRRHADFGEFSGLRLYALR